jgi:hypothetical protein
MLLDLTPVYPKVSLERKPSFHCHISLKKLLLKMCSPVNIMFISNELKENENGFQIRYDNFI